MNHLAIIVAYATPSRAIGDGTGMLWHHPADMKHFRAVTTAHAVIMGRRTWASLPKPLPLRRNIVLSRDPNYCAVGAEVFPDLSTALAAARTSDRCPMIIGGGTLYAEALPLATALYLTEVREPHDGAVKFPSIDESQWTEVHRREDGVLLFRELRRRLDEG